VGGAELVLALSVAEVAAVLGAELTGTGDPAALVTSVSADTRTIGPGGLFVALPGARTDGHAFVPAAFAAGATAALTRHTVPGALCVVVTDPLVALGRLARHLVDRAAATGLRVVGITGSQGKTSTKDLLSQVLEVAGPTVAPAGNLNNELGVPLTVSRIDEQTRFLVAEMGARGIGHIAYLCDIAPPLVGVVLNVGQAHVGEFGGRAAIAQAKGELVEALPADGFAVLNATDPLVWAMRDRTAAQVRAFSVAGPPDEPGVWASAVLGDALGRYAFRLHSAEPGKSERDVEVQLQVAGRHQVDNALAAAAAATALGLDLRPVAAALSGATARSRWRMELRQRRDGVTVLNDAYNANPDSMRAAVDTLAELSRQRTRRTWAVLGDMLELGEVAEQAHAELGALVADRAIDRLVAVGVYAESMAAAARQGGLTSDAAVRAFPDKAAAQADVLDRLAPGDVVLVKASRGLALDTVAEAILAFGEDSP
jgi:UDP-N-acetylmuramoyl-tripeptide--D-alanyl-D-alanine ligase